MEAGEPPCTALLLGPDPPPPRLGPCRTFWAPVYRAVGVPGAPRLLLAALGGAGALVFTSPRAPRLLASEAAGEGLLEELRSSVAGVRVYAVGPKTAWAAREYLGVEARVPGEYTVESLARMVAGSEEGPVVAARSPQANRVLGEVLASHGIAYGEVHVYTLREEPGWRERAGRARYDFLVLTSPRLAIAAIKAGLQGPIVAIGPATAGTVKSAGLEPACVAGQSTLEGVAACLEKLALGEKPWR